jgi:hypothetical protein
MSERNSCRSVPSPLMHSSYLDVQNSHSGVCTLHTAPHFFYYCCHYCYQSCYVFVFLVVSFLLDFPPITYTRSSSLHSCYILILILILLDLIILIILGEEYKLRSSLLCSFLHSAVTSCFFGPNILLSTLFSNTLSLCSSLNVRDQFSHPYRTTGKSIVLYILIFRFFDCRLEDRRFWTEW